VQRLNQTEPGQLGRSRAAWLSRSEHRSALHDHDHQLILVIDDLEKGRAVSEAGRVNEPEDGAASSTTRRASCFTSARHESGPQPLGPRYPADPLCGRRVIVIDVDRIPTTMLVSTSDWPLTTRRDFSDVFVRRRCPSISLAAVTRNQISPLRKRRSGPCRLRFGRIM